MVTFGIIAIIGAGAYSVYEIDHLKKVNTFQSNQIKLLKEENIAITKEIINKSKIIEHYQKNNLELAHEIRDLKSKLKYARENIKERHHYIINPKQNQQQKYTNYQPKQKTQINTNSKPNYQTNKSQKKYQKFSNKIKFVSDSTITKLPDNRMTSNMPIKGRYYPPISMKEIIYQENCNRKENLYNAVDECSMKITWTGDIIYSSKMNVKDLKEFDKNTHMIECEYSKDHGILHNCMKKLKS